MEEISDKKYIFFYRYIKYLLKIQVITVYFKNRNKEI